MYIIVSIVSINLPFIFLHAQLCSVSNAHTRGAMKAAEIAVAPFWTLPSYTATLSAPYKLVKPATFPATKE